MATGTCVYTKSCSLRVAVARRCILTCHYRKSHATAVYTEVELDVLTTVSRQAKHATDCDVCLITPAGHIVTIDSHSQFTSNFALFIVENREPVILVTCFVI